MTQRAGSRSGLIALSITWALHAGCTEERGERDRGAAETAARVAVGLRFTELGPETGIDLVTKSGVHPATQILEVKGGGLALFDDDGDGDLDVFVPGGATLERPQVGQEWRLYRNEGELRFRDVTGERRIAERRWGFGVAVGDYDGDGRDDLYVACYGPNVLLRNLPGGYRECGDAAGIADARWSTSAAFGDLDGDGDLDLYVTNYLELDPKRPPPPAVYKGETVFGGPLGLPAQADVVYENQGDGTFRDVSTASGCARVPAAYGLNVAILDFDGDGRQDIFVANDSTPNFLFRNLGGGRFEERGLASGVAADGDGGLQASMGIAVGDVDGNGFADVFTTNFASDANTLQLNQDGRHFLDGTRLYGLARVSWPFVGWACELADFDHDGDEDLFVLNGHVYPQATVETMDSSYLQPPLLMERGAERFESLDPGAGGAWLARARCGRSAAFGDLDGDGDVDVVTSELNGPIRILRNDSARAAREGWLIVELADDRSGVANRRGIGSRVALVDGARQQTRWIRGGGPFQSANAPAVHFATRAPGAPVRLHITWPDGGRTEHAGVEWGRRITLRRE